MQALANAVDTTAAAYLQGARSARPAAGVAGRLYYSTDQHQTSYDNGTQWRTIGPYAAGGVNPDGTVWLPGTANWTPAHVTAGYYTITFTVPTNSATPIALANATISPYFVFAWDVQSNLVGIKIWNPAGNAQVDCGFVFTVWDL
jgi:hypothetical protein